jgi:hypothetical protein
MGRGPSARAERTARRHSTRRIATVTHANDTRQTHHFVGAPNTARSASRRAEPIPWSFFLRIKPHRSFNALSHATHHDGN